MKVAVCVKQIPDPALPGELDPTTNTLKRDDKLILDECVHRIQDQASHPAVGRAFFVSP